MRSIGLAILGVASLLGTGAIAQTTNVPKSNASSGMAKLSQSECTSLWQQATAGGSKLSEPQAAPYITDFKAANSDGDSSIDQNEWMSACNKGLVKSSSSSGSSSGTSGSSSPKVNPAEHAPTNRMDSQVPPMLPPEKSK